MKAIIDKHIISLAYRTFGDFRSRILLSLPPAHVAKGKLHLGTVLYEKYIWPGGITHAELFQNLAIFGRSGAGKTNVAFDLLEQLGTKSYTN